MFEILVVDNHPLVLEYLAQLLGKEGYTVLCAEDGLAAVDILREHTPKVMLIDLIMPNIDGQTLCRIIRQMPVQKDAFLVLLSATAAEMPASPESYQANAFIAKGPFKKMAAHILDVLDLAKRSGFKGVINEVKGLEDIHAREITKELLSLKHHFEVVLASMSEGILEINAARRIVYANKAAIGITRLAEDQILSRAFSELFADSEQKKVEAYLQQVAACRPDTAPAGIEVQLADKELELRVYPTEEDAQMSIVLLMDNTERKRFEAQLRRSQRMESIGTLAAGVAHDFNNLLTVVQGNADIMSMDLQQTHPHHERLQEILRQVQSAKRLTGQLLGYARKGRFEARQIDLNQLIRDTVETFGRTRKEISIDLRLDPQLDLFEGDSGQIEQMVLNLLLNAGDAMPSGGELEIKTGNVDHKEISSDVFTVKPGKYVRLAVHDTGTGMDTETRERVFEPFYTTKEMGRGTGLGLASVYGIVKGHGGYIEVESKVGKGTTFRIYLPVKPAKTEQGEPESPKKQRTKQPSRGTVLLVDDERDVRNVASQILRKLNYDVLPAGSGREAVKLYRKNKKEIVLVMLDIVMPGLGGSEAFQELKQTDPAVKVLLCSGYSIQGEADRLLSLGASGFIQKPFSMKCLEESISSILGSAPEER